MSAFSRSWIYKAFPISKPQEDTTFVIWREEKSGTPACMFVGNSQHDDFFLDDSDRRKIEFTAKLAP